MLSNLGRKGIVNFIEAIFVIIAIFTAFAVLFPGLSFKSKWSVATGTLYARDTILAMDRLGILYKSSFDSNSLQNFVDTVIPINKTGLIEWSEVDGTVGSTIKVACNCTADQINNLNYWMSGMQINGRSVNFVFVPTSLDSINPDADALLIWGSTNLDNYLTNFQNYLSSGGGIVEINDFKSASDVGNYVQQQIFGLTWREGVKIEFSHSEPTWITASPGANCNTICANNGGTTANTCGGNNYCRSYQYGNECGYSTNQWDYGYLGCTGGWNGGSHMDCYGGTTAWGCLCEYYNQFQCCCQYTVATTDYFTRKPINSADIIYGTYKYFSHIGVPLKTFESNYTFPIEKNMQQPVCPTIYHGNLTFNNNVYNFWICNSTTVYFDTNLNSYADTALIVGKNFTTIDLTSNLTLRYVNYPTKIGISFDPNNEFQDFLAAWTPPGEGQGCDWEHYYNVQVTPVDNNPLRILMNASFSQNQYLPVVILNNTLGRTAWMADFTNDPNFANGCKSASTPGDNDKLLLASLLMWASKKQQLPTSSISLQHGVFVPYINVMSSDMYEVYQFNLGLRSPFES